MNVLIINYQFNKNGAVASHRSIGLANSFADKGCKVTVLTCTNLAMEQADHNNIKLISVENPLLSLLHQLFPVQEQDNANNKNELSSHWIRAKIDHFRKKSGILFLGRMPDVADIWYWKAKKIIRKSPTWDLVVSSYAPYDKGKVGHLVFIHQADSPRNRVNRQKQRKIKRY